jgi:hypothetical protein
MKKPKLYKLIDYHPERKWASNGIVSGSVMAINSKQFRCPKKGEWYLSGAIPGAYKASNDLNTKYYIATLVKVTEIIEYVLKEIPNE